MWNTVKEIFSGRLILSVFVVLCMCVIYFIIVRLKKGYYKKYSSTGAGATVMQVLFSVLQVAVLLVGILFILEINGVNITGMLAGLGIASAIVGLAFQDYLRDLIMGVRILTDRFFTIGEVVEYEGQEGEIVSLNIKTTKIRSMKDNSITTICNRNITEIKKIGDCVVLDIPLSYNEDVKQIHSLLSKFCVDMENYVIIHKVSYKGTQAFEDSAILYRIMVYCDPIDRPDARRVAIKVIQEGLDAAGISIPFNQLDVHWDEVGKSK